MREYLRELKRLRIVLFAVAAFFTGYCVASAQSGTVSASEQATCTQEATGGGGIQNVLRATSTTYWTGTAWSGHTVGSRIHPVTMGFDQCVSSSSSGSDCVSTVNITGNVTAQSQGKTTGPWLGDFDYQSTHYRDGSNILAGAVPIRTTCSPITYGGGQVCNGPNGSCGSSPILIPLHATDNGNGTPLTDAAGGVLFDINADGAPEQTAWTADDSTAFLAVDRDGDGAITSGLELFGDATDGNHNGFLALNDYMNHQPIDSSNPRWSTLLLWVDRNHNGVSEPDELLPASSVLTAIGTGAMGTGKRDHYGNLFEWQGFATYLGAIGTRPIYDVRFTQ